MKAIEWIAARVHDALIGLMGLGDSEGEME